MRTLYIQKTRLIIRLAVLMLIGAAAVLIGSGIGSIV